MSTTQFGVLEGRHSLIAALDTQGITPPSMRVELFKLQGLYTIKTYSFDFQEITNISTLFPGPR